MTTKEILNTRNERGIISMSNESANWEALSRDGIHMITFYSKDEIKFYKNENSFAKRVIQLLQRGY